MFRVGGSCNFPILCAHFLYDNKWQILSRGTINIPTLTLCFKWTIQNVYKAITYICTYSFIFLVLYFSCILLFFKYQVVQPLHATVRGKNCIFWYSLSSLLNFSSLFHSWYLFLWRQSSIFRQKSRYVKHEKTFKWLYKLHLRNS